MIKKEHYITMNYVRHIPIVGVSVIRSPAMDYLEHANTTQNLSSLNRLTFNTILLLFLKTD